MNYKLKKDFPIENHNAVLSYLKAYGFDDIEKFKNPSKDSLLSLKLIENIDIGADLLDKHLRDSKIGIVVDCDQDGITSAALLWLYLKELNPKINLVYALHEEKQHGLTKAMMEFAEDVDLIILPDSSSNDYEQHKKLKELGIDVLVIDHHEAPYYSEDAVVINTTMSEKYENNSLSGAAVVLKFCQYLDEYYNVGPLSDKYYDLAAVGIVGDMMDLVHEETRYIVKRGLSNIINPGLTGIIDNQNFSIGDGPITPIKVSFNVAPLINAILRVGTMEEKDLMFSAFIEGNAYIQSTKRGAKNGELESISSQSARNSVNAKNRQNTSKENFVDRFKMEVLKNSLDENKIIIIQLEPDIEMNPTLTGLIANVLANYYKKPTLIVKDDGRGNFKGSGRNIEHEGFPDLKAFLLESKLVEYAEGHGNAHGVYIKEDKIEALTKYTNEKLKDINFNEKSVVADFILEGDKPYLAEYIKQIGEETLLWGKGVNKPNFIIKNIFLDKSEIHFIGAKQNTCKFVYAGIEYIQFNALKIKEQLENLSTDKLELTVLGDPSINVFAGQSKPQIKILALDINS